MSRETLVCHICGQKFVSKRGNLRRHLKEKHEIVVPVEYGVKCMEPDCVYTCPKLKDLRTHLGSVHEIPQEVEELKFDSVEDFNEWKADEERRCGTSWIRGSSYLKEDSIYYYCSKTMKPKRHLNSRQKRVKAKMDFSCTSAIIVRRLAGRVRVIYYKTHYRHHLPLLAQKNDKTQSKPLEEDILKTIKSGEDQDFECVHLISRDHIHDIVRDYNLQSAFSESYRVQMLNKISRINRSHIVAANAQSMVVVQQKNEWKLRYEDKTFYVRSNNTKEEHSCKLKCASCGCCLHDYKCTCMDYVQNNNICKHIHRVCMTNGADKKGPTKETSGRDIKKNLDTLLILSEWCGAHNEATLNRINSHLESAISLLAEGLRSQFNSNPADLMQPLGDIQNKEASKIVQIYYPVIPMQPPNALQILQRYRPIVPRLPPEAPKTDCKTKNNLNVLCPVMPTNVPPGTIIPLRPQTRFRPIRPNGAIETSEGEEDDDEEAEQLEIIITSEEGDELGRQAEGLMG